MQFGKEFFIKKIVCLFLAFAICFNIFGSAYAAEGADTTLTDDLKAANDAINTGIVSDASGNLIKVMKLDNGSYAFYNIISTSDNDSISAGIVIANNHADALLLASTLSNGSMYDSQYALGASLYMEMTIYYSTKSGTNGTLYKITSIVVKSQVNNGTIIDSKYLNISANGTSESGTAFSQNPSINITGLANPYTSTLPNSYPYIYSGLSLGAAFIVIAHRPSGSNYTYSIPLYIFQGV